jgi:6-pyruvoyltetrahydropterin/6-carboxytetrahydropterin synthase
MWTIDKSFNFEMGHRVWAQKLEHAHLSLSTDCACKHLHGHSYEIKVFLGSDTLDQSSMVTDFKNINFMKRFVDDVLDHKFMIDVNDPMFSRITGGSVEGHTIPNFTNLLDIAESIGWKVDADYRDFVRSFVLVNFVPTSENICKYLKEYAQEQIKDVAKVVALELWETKKSHCRYE